MTKTNNNEAIIKPQIEMGNQTSLVAKNTDNTKIPHAEIDINDNCLKKFTIENDLAVTILNYGAYQSMINPVPLNIFLKYIPGIHFTKNGLLLQFTTGKGNVIYICSRRIYLGGPKSVLEAQDEHRWFAAYVNYFLRKQSLPYTLNIEICEKATSINANFVYKHMVPMQLFEKQLREIWWPYQIFLKHRPDRQIFCHFVYNLEVEWKKSRKVALLVSYQRHREYMFLQLKGLEHEYQIPILLNPILKALDETLVICSQ